MSEGRRRARARGHQGGGSVYQWKRKNPKTGELEQVGWVAIADVGRDSAGKRRRQAIYGKTQREVTERLNELLRDHQRGVLPKAGRMTVEQWLRRWQETDVANLRPRTREHYDWCVRIHLIPALGPKQLAKLTPSDVTLMLGEKVRAGLSPRSVHHVRAVLRNALHAAEVEGLVSRNVARLAKAPAIPAAEMKTLTPDQVETFVAAIKDHPLEALFTTTLGLGLRQGEVLGLRWSDIDLEARNPSTGQPAPTLRVTKALQWLRPADGGPGEAHLGEPKSAESRRILRVPDFVADALRSHRAQWRDQRLRLGPKWLNEWDLVFVGPYGEPLRPHVVLEELHDVLAGASLPRIRFHDLRHSCASLLGARGVPVKVVAAILGHSTPALTQRTYQHVFAEQHDQAAAVMDAILGR